MAMQRALLTIAAVLEVLAGAALIVVPALTISLLLGSEPHSDGSMIGRIAGAALLALGIACWWARADAGGAARNGTLNAITLYNAGAGLLLVVFAATGKAGGLVTGLAGILHCGLAAAFVISRIFDSRTAIALPTSASVPAHVITGRLKS
jgi:hypothetical protein